jgi:LCP family protein required for cell wall assembly
VTPDGQPPGPPPPRPPGPPPTPPSGAPDAPPPGTPEYKVYRSRRPGPLDRLRDKRPSNPFERFRRDRRPSEPKDPYRLKPRRRITPGRVLKWVLLAVLGWILLSIVLFFISAATQDGVSERTERALNNSGSLLTGSTVLVIGSDARPDDTKEPQPDGGFGERADSIILMRVGAGSVRRLSIPRDTRVETSDYTGKVNGAFAGGGGAARLIDVLEEYLGNDLQINHVVEVDFENFPEFIDSLGGVDVRIRGRCVRPANRFGGYGIRELTFKRGEAHMNGRQALGFSRIRQNACNPGEDDRARAARQQDVVAGIRDQAFSFGTFVRLPVVAWNAPKAVKSDMQGPGLSALFFDLATGGSGTTRILEPSSASGTELIVEEAEREQEVERLLGRD